MLETIPFDYYFPLAVLGDFGLVGLFPNHSHAGGELGGGRVSHFIIPVTRLIQPYVKNLMKLANFAEVKIDHIHLLTSVLQRTTWWLLKMLKIGGRLHAAKEKAYLKEIIYLLCELK